MFDSIFKNGTEFYLILITSITALIVGIIYSYLASVKLRSSKGYFITIALMPALVSVGISVIQLFLTDSTSTNIARIASIGIALGLIRFRSNTGSAEEMILLLSSVIFGFIFGIGYIAYGVISMLLFIIIYMILVSTNIFNNKKFKKEKLLKITIPESLNYENVFDDSFIKYLDENELVEVKTFAMGSMYKLSYRIILKNKDQEKELIDELRIRNGNLEISIQQYVEIRNTL